MKFSEILKLLMQQKNVTAYKMSKETGIPQAVIGRWKNGEQQPSNENLKKIADYFDVSSDFLLSREISVREGDIGYSGSKVINIDKDGRTVKVEISKEDWEKYNTILRATMPHLFEK